MFAKIRNFKLKNANEWENEEENLTNQLHLRVEIILSQKLQLQSEIIELKKQLSVITLERDNFKLKQELSEEIVENDLMSSSWISSKTDSNVSTIDG